MTRPLHTAITCGGTGGHVFPGLATGQQLLARGHRVRLWLTGRSVEAPSIAGWAGETFGLRCSAPRFSNPVIAMKSIAMLLQAYRDARRQMRAERPDVLLAMGSYTSFGPVLAARSLALPVVMHEANAVPGRAVSRLSRGAACVAISLPGAAAYLPRRRTVLTGMPVRPELAEAQPYWPPRGGAFTLMVTGGSQGARSVNEAVVAAVRRLWEQGRRELRVLHLAGPKEADTVRALYEGAPGQVEVFGFLEQMGRAYGAADLVVSRAGAASCAELCLCGCASLLIPLPSAVRDHQRLNAQALADAGAAELWRQSDLTSGALAEYISTCMREPDRLRRQGAAARRLARPDAAERLAELVESIARG